MEAKVIRSLCNDFIAEEIEMPKTYFKKGDKMENIKNDLLDKLKENTDKELLEKMVSLHSDMNDIEIEEYFVYGFSLGVQLASEAFQCKI